MKVEAPLLPYRAHVIPPPDVSLAVPQLRNRPLEAIQAKVEMTGLSRGITWTQERLGQLLDLTNRKLQANVRTKSMHFQIHEASGKVVATLYDNGVAIRQYPAEKLLENAAILKGAGRLTRVIG